MRVFARLDVRQWPLVTRIAALCISIALVLALGVTAISYVAASRGLSEQADARLGSDGAVVARLVDDWNAKHMQLAHSVATLPILARTLEAGDNASDADIAAVTEILASYGGLADGSSGSGVSVIDANGVGRFSDTINGRSFTAREYFQAAIKGNDYISGVTMAITGTGGQSIFVATPIKDAGKIVGVAVVVSDATQIQKAIDAERARFAGDAIGALVDEQGLVIANTLDAGWLLRPVVQLKPDVEKAQVAGMRWGLNVQAPDPLGETDLVAAVGATHPTSFTWQTHGTTYHAVATPLANTQWTYVAALPVASFEAASIELLRTSSVAVAVGALLAALVIMLLMRPLADGLRQLTVAAHGLAEGDIDQQVSINGRDELGQMAAAFRALIGYQREMAAAADAIAAGDLTRAVQPASERDTLGTAFASMRTNLSDLVARVQEVALGVAHSSADLGTATAQAGTTVQQFTQAIQNVAAGAQDTSRSAQETNDAVAQLGDAIDGIARGASDQARQVQAASATATQMAAGVEQVASNAHSVAAASEQTRASAEQGAAAVRETVTGMTDIREVVAQAAGKVQDLGKLGDKIGAVVETIDDVAEQTNLLALNAAIEAARAGEHGKGFAVVADEVRKLAERSSRETKQIAGLIRDVQTGTKDAVAAMEAGAVKVQQGSARADQAGVALEQILRAVESTVRQVTEIASSSQEMAAGARSMTDAMQSISAVVEENTAATEEMAAQSGQVSTSIQAIAAVAGEQSAASEQVSASAEEMSAQVEEMGAQAQELAVTADQLKSLVARFKLDHSNAGTAQASDRVVPLRRAA